MIDFERWLGEQGQGASVEPLTPAGRFVYDERDGSLCVAHGDFVVRYTDSPVPQLIRWPVVCTANTDHGALEFDDETGTLRPVEPAQ